MKVMLFNHFPLFGSGSGTYTIEVGKALAKKGHEVVMVYPEHLGFKALGLSFNRHQAFYKDEDGLWHAPIFCHNDLTTIEEAENLPFNFPCFTSHPRSHTTYYELSEPEIENYLGEIAKKMTAVMEVFQPEILHIQHVWLGAYAAIKTDIPFVITCHGTDLMGYEKDSRFRYYADEAAKKAAFIIGVSNQVSDKVTRTYPIAGEKVLTMISGYNQERFNLKSKKPIEVVHQIKSQDDKAQIVSFAGKMTPFKGVDVLLEAAKDYERHLPHLYTIIAGDGILYAQLNERAKCLGLKRTHFTGNLTQSELSSLYQSATIHVVPSREEPFGLVAVEALACGTPVIGTNAGGLPEIIKEAVGGLVPVDDATALAEEIFEWTKRNSARSHEKVCHEHAKRYFSWDKVANALEACYERAIQIKQKV